MRSLLLFAAALLAAPALAQDGGATFKDAANGAVVHADSGLLCPKKIGPFERNAVGRRNPDKGSDYCSYSAISGVYGTIVIMPLPATFDPKALLAFDFMVQEGSGAKLIGETIQPAGPVQSPVPVYRRTYETARLEALHYQTLFAIAAVGAWSVEVIVEDARPRDKDLERAFLDAVYGQAVHDLGSPAE